MVIAGVYYVICFAVLTRLILTTSPLRTLALGLVGMVMFVNALWNVFFFRTGNFRHAFLVGLAYSAAALVLLLVLWRVDLVAASCFSPYVIYLFYANVWDYRVWQLNRPVPLTNNFCNAKPSEPTGLEPATSAVTGRRSNQLS